MKKLFDVAIAGEINLDLILYGLPEDMPFRDPSLVCRLLDQLGSRRQWQLAQTATD